MSEYILLYTDTDTDRQADRQITNGVSLLFIMVGIVFVNLIIST